jgi:hypothetical protein
MRTSRLLAGSASAAALLVFAAPALAGPPTLTGLTGKDASSTTQTVCTVVQSAQQFPCHVDYMWDTTANALVPVLADHTSGFQGVTVENGSVAVSGTVGGLTGVGQTGSIIRAANTTAYAGAAAQQLICLNNSVTVCAPIQVTIAGTNAATGTMGRVTLEKTSTTITGATFTIYFFSGAPTTTSKFDASAYPAPFAADITSGAYLGSYTCNAMQATADATAQAFSECTPTAPQGWMQYQTLSGQTFVDALLVVTGNYTPSSAEVFTITANSYRDK